MASPLNQDRSDPPKAADGQLIICHCMQVDLATIRAAIATGARSIRQLQDATRACLGCGTCRFELTELLTATARPEAS